MLKNAVVIWGASRLPRKERSGAGKARLTVVWGSASATATTFAPEAARTAKARERNSEAEISTATRVTRVRAIFVYGDGFADFSTIQFPSTTLGFNCKAILKQ